MKQWAALIFLINLCWLTQVSSRDVPRATWDAATAAYDQAEYATAIALYQELLPDFDRSAALHHNLGNCHFRLGEIPTAILHYERALILRPGA
ncbi:MAG: tetratricopeptide repeat protein, partial [Saprospiraceae bacterium]|nr:tetratricopeptide repeat protein [Saprospiraceae bacterium]